MDAQTARSRSVIAAFVEHVPALVGRHATPEGHARFLPAAGVDPYGAANAIGVLWSVDALPGAADRERLVSALLGCADEDGAYRDPTHGVFHTTALATGSLALLGGRPAAPRPFAELWDPQRVPEFLGQRDWNGPWLASHEVAGLAATGLSTDRVDSAWFDAYLGWLDAHVDSATGMWGPAGRLQEWPGLFGNLGGAFHMHFIYRWNHRLLPEPVALVDSCIRIYDDSDAVGRRAVMGWPELDWAFCARHASLESGHRVGDVRARLEDLTARVVEVLEAPGFGESDHVTDLHALSALVALVAELVGAFPELAPEGRPIRSILDARPFI